MKYFTAAATLLLLTACATTPKIPPDLVYNPPAHDTASTATIVGSQKEIVFLDDFTAYVVTVDGKRVLAERKGWNQELVVRSGMRNIDVVFERGSFSAQSKLDFEALAGHRYQLKFDSDVGVVGKNSRCDFWVIDAENGEPASGIAHGVIKNSYTPVFIP